MQTATQSTPARMPAPFGVSQELTGEQVQACDFRAIRTFDKTSLAPLTLANETFAKTLTNVLSARLNLACEVSVHSLDALDGRVRLEKSSDASYFIALDLAPLQETALLQIEPTLIFPLVDALLGGNGKPVEILREITEIEDLLILDIVRVLCQELQSAWRAYNIEVRPGRRQTSDELRQTSFFSGRMLASSFSINLPEIKGGMQLMMPVSCLSAFVRADSKASSPEASSRHAMSPTLAAKIADFNFGLDLTLPGAKVQASDLLDLTVGKVIKLGVSLRTMAVLGVGGRGAFEAVPVRVGRNRAAQLLDPVGCTTITEAKDSL